MILVEYLEREYREETTTHRDQGEGAYAWILTGDLSLQSDKHTEKRRYDELKGGWRDESSKEIQFHSKYRTIIEAWE